MIHGDQPTHDLMHRQLLVAQRDAEQAGRRHAARCTAAATALLRTVFPSAAHVVLNVAEWYDNTGSVHLDTILDHEHTVLWRHTDVPRAGSPGATLPAEVMLARQHVEDVWDTFLREVANYFEQALDFGYPDTLGWEPVDPKSGDYTGPYHINLPATPYLPDPRAAADDFDHDRTTEPCRLVARSTDSRNATPSGTSWLVTCTMHDTDERVYADDVDLARARFVCDRGRRWYFLAHRRDDWCPPELLTLTALADEIRAFLRADNDPETYNGGGWDLLVVHRYLTQHADCLPLDVLTRYLGGQTVLVAVREQDTPVPLPPVDVNSIPDTYGADGVTYLLMVIDLAGDGGIVIDATTQPGHRLGDAEVVACRSGNAEPAQLLPVRA